MRMTPEQYAAAIEALNASRNFLRQFKAVVTLADALEKIGELWSEIHGLEAEKTKAEISIVGLNERKAILARCVEELQAEVDALERHKRKAEAEIQALKERFAHG